MIRPIKLRGWNKKLQAMFGVGSIMNMDYDDSSEFKYATNDGQSAGVGDGVHLWLDIELMQFTGLKDKSGKEIFEGDILEHSWKPMGKTEPHVKKLSVGFYDGAFKQHEPGDDEDVWALWYDWSELEVIGNVWENPELLEGATNGKSA